MTEREGNYLSLKRRETEGMLSGKRSDVSILEFTLHGIQTLWAGVR
jgi:hypothetical protein